MFYIFMTQTAFGGMISEICEENRIKTESILAAELEASGCQDCSVEGQNPMVKRVVQHSFDVIEKFRITHPELNQDKDLNIHFARQLISEEFVYGPRTNDSRVDSSNPLTSALFELHTKYQFARSDSGYTKIQSEYIGDLNRILRMTKKGQDLLDCFERKPDYIVNEVTVDMKLQDKAFGFVGHHRLIPFKKGGQNFYKNVITLNPVRRPVEVLSTYIHELAHACNWQERIKYNDNFERMGVLRRQIKNPKISKTDKQVMRDELISLVDQTNQFAFTDEIKAFSIQARFNQELVKADPIHFCILPEKEFFAEKTTTPFFARLEDTLTDGTFSRKVLLRYLQLSQELTSQNSFFEYSDLNLKTDPNITLEQLSKIKWKPEVKKKIDEALTSEAWAPAN